jgi:hypothetical protein
MRVAAVIIVASRRWPLASSEAADVTQRRAQVVRDGVAERFQLAVDGFELGGALLEFAGGAFLLGDVASRRVDQVAGTDRHGSPTEPPERAVFAAIPVLE